jgi:hypothetical protein
MSKKTLHVEKQGRAGERGRIQASSSGMFSFMLCLYASPLNPSRRQLDKAS